MSIQLELKQNDFLTLEDAIAYEFFMESAVKIMDSADKEGFDIAAEVTKLAVASYLIANIFCEARSFTSKQINDADA